MSSRYEEEELNEPVEEELKLDEEAAKKYEVPPLSKQSTQQDKVLEMAAAMGAARFAEMRQLENQKKQVGGLDNFHDLQAALEA